MRRTVALAVLACAPAALTQDALTSRPRVQQAMEFIHAHHDADIQKQVDYESFKTHGRPKIMFYFMTSAFYTADLQALAQFGKVAEFRKKLEKLGLLYWTYQTPLEFERNVREHLTRRILDVADAVAKERSGRKPIEYRQPVGQAKARSIFLAYSHQDRETARSIYAMLRGAWVPGVDGRARFGSGSILAQRGEQGDSRKRRDSGSRFGRCD